MGTVMGARSIPSDPDYRVSILMPLCLPRLREYEDLY